jgi:nucleoside 2-deoxyribosyltransferase
MEKQTCYLAGPLFSDGERSFNLGLALLLEREFVVYLPQRDGLLLRDLREIGEDSAEIRHRIYETDIAAITACDIVVAVLDGPSVDDGVSFELGYATCLCKIAVGLATDSRRVPGYFRNPMWEGALEKLFYSTDELLEWAHVFAMKKRSTVSASVPLISDEVPVRSHQVTAQEAGSCRGGS